MTIKKTLGLTAAVAGAGLVAFVAPQARADVGVVFTNPLQPTFSAGPGSGQYTYIYMVELAAGETLSETGLKGSDNVSRPNFFTIYDFGGYVANSAKYVPDGSGLSSSLFSVSESNLGMNPRDTNAVAYDSPLFSNITFTYNSSVDTVSNGPNALPLGEIQFTSTEDPSQLISNPNGLGQETNNQGTGSLDRQLGGFREPAAVPEPSSIALFGFGGFGLLGLALRARKGRAAVA